MSESMDSFIDLPSATSPGSVVSKEAYSTSPSMTSPTAQTIIPTTQGFSAPSHQYDLYKQTTGMVPGAIASTLAVNQSNPQIAAGWDMGYNSGISPDDSFNFNVPLPQGTPEMDMDFASPGTENFLFPESTINPNSLTSQGSPVVPSNGPNAGRMWPGIHQQQALAKAQAQQRQQQQLIQQRQQQAQQQTQHAKRPSKSASPSDPMVEQKITQLLNSMRAKPSQPDAAGMNNAMLQVPRPKKEEDDMDDDERLLNSEEGKKLSSKERRQLRNKVSARAFRSRRKEYISQLELEIANKVNENGNLRAQNRALADENRKLTDLTRMLLSSPHFSDFLQELATNPEMAAPEPQRPEERQMPKDVNPYGGGNHQVGMAMIPEANVDMSLLSMDASMPDGSFNYQPQVYNAVVAPLEPIDASVLSGKTEPSLLEEEDPEEFKDAVVVDCTERPVGPVSEAVVEPELDENDPTLDLYRSAPTPSQSTREHTSVIAISEEREDDVDFFGGVESEKVFARYDLVDPTEAQLIAATQELDTVKFERSCARLDACLARLARLGFE